MPDTSRDPFSPAVLLPEQFPRRHSFEAHSGERGLWAAVLEQAIDDALLPAEQVRSDARRAREEARDFIRHDSLFATLCQIFGIDADAAREALIRQMDGVH